MIWRTLERYACHSEVGRWIQGLPSVLGLEFTRDTLTICCLFVMMSSIQIMSGELSGIGILLNALAGLMMIVVQFVYPVVLSEQIRCGSNGLKAIHDAMKKISRHTWRWLILNVLPGLFKGLIVCLMMIGLQMNGSGYLWMEFAGLIILGLISCIEPAFWMVWDQE